MTANIIAPNGDRRFASMNSSGGFYSLFSDVFGSLFDLYILKGGPGTGKSHVMSSLGRLAEQKDLKCEYYHCSSDPDSLDGIIIRQLGVGMVDGTSPHTLDPKYPGAVDRIIDLGRFWDEEKLKNEKRRIISLSNSKSLAYGRAASLLSSRDNLLSECERTILTYFDRSKAEKTVSRMLSRLFAGKKPVEEIFITSSPGMKGIWRSPCNLSGERVYITTHYGAEYEFLSLIRREAASRGMRIAVSPSPFRKGRENAVYFHDADILYYTEEDKISDSDTQINILRFLSNDKPDRKNLRRLKKAGDNLLTLSLDAFDDMRRAHFALEEIYSSAMDFKKEEAFAEEIFARILKSR